MRKAQKYAETWEEYYKVLKIKNKYLLAKLQKTKKLTKNNYSAHVEELPSTNRNLLNENNLSSRSYFSSKGFLVIFDLITINLCL